MKRLKRITFTTVLMAGALAFVRGFGGQGAGGQSPGPSEPAMPAGAVAAVTTVPAPNAGFAGLGNQGGGMDADALQKRIGATDEEWIVLWPKLRDIIHLRDEVRIGLDGTSGGRNRGFGGGGFGMGGSGLEAPDNLGMGAPTGVAALVMPNMASQPDPFNPNKVPGMEKPPTMVGSLLKLVGVQAPAGGGGEMFNVGQGNAVKALLTELATLLADKNATPDQLRDKMMIIRATRTRAAADLRTAEDELAKLLTAQQEAVLVGAGYID